MDDSIHATLARWGNFYLITGTAAAALTGLQFVVQTLLASDRLRPVTDNDTEGGIAAFGTPTVVHFALALLISAVVCAPWAEYGGLRAILGVLGAGALGYSAVVLRRAATLILIFVGVHNAWDTVTYLTINALQTEVPEGEPAPPRRENPRTRGRRRR